MKARTSPRDTGRARTALERIDHIVVLMLENRSFDHKFGYLSLPGHGLPDRGELPVKVEGLDLADPRFTIEHERHPYSPEPLDEEAFHEKDLDPPHNAASVAAQMAGGQMNGFVSAFAKALQERGAGGANDPEVLKSVMGYLTPDRIPGPIISRATSACATTGSARFRALPFPIGSSRSPGPRTECSTTSSSSSASSASSSRSSVTSARTIGAGTRRTRESSGRSTRRSCSTTPPWIASHTSTS